MKIAVLGGTGATGKHVVEKALAQGHQVTALARKPEAFGITHERLKVIGGDPTSSADIEACLTGADVVIHCLGIGGKGKGVHTTLISDSVKAVLAAMNKLGVKRIVCMSNVGAGGSGVWLVQRVIVPIAVRWLMPIIEDKDRMEAALKASNVEWVSVRLPGIVNGPSKPTRTSVDGRKNMGFTITAASTADFLLARIQGAEFIGETPSVSN